MIDKDLRETQLFTVMSSGNQAGSSIGRVQFTWSNDSQLCKLFATMPSTDDFNLQHTQKRINQITERNMSPQ